MDEALNTAMDVSNHFILGEVDKILAGSYPQQTQHQHLENPQPQNHGILHGILASSHGGPGVLNNPIPHPHYVHHTPGPLHPHVQAHNMPPQNHLQHPMQPHPTQQQQQQPPLVQPNIVNRVNPMGMSRANSMGGLGRGGILSGGGGIGRGSLNGNIMNRGNSMGGVVNRGGVSSGVGRGNVSRGGSIRPNITGVAAQEAKKKRRRKKGNSVDWKANLNKKLRLEGKAYLGYSKGPRTKHDTPRKAREVGPPCESSFCEKSKVRKCSEFSLQDREKVFTTFWSKLQTWNEKKVFVSCYVKREEQKRKRKEGNGRREASQFYFLPLKGTIVQVCKKMFLNTLALGECQVRTWVIEINGRPVDRQPDEVIKQSVDVSSNPVQETNAQDSAPDVQGQTQSNAQADMSNSTPNNTLPSEDSSIEDAFDTNNWSNLKVSK